MKSEKIAQLARELQVEIWHSRNKLWASVDLPPVYRMFTADVAAQVLNIEYELHPQLGCFGDGERRFEVAGVIDRQRNVIAVSQNFNPAIQRFTGAHEVAHWQLHKNRVVMHRDRQISGLTPTRSPRSPQE